MEQQHGARHCNVKASLKSLRHPRRSPLRVTSSRSQPSGQCKPQIPQQVAPSLKCPRRACPRAPGPWRGNPPPFMSSRVRNMILNPHAQNPRATGLCICLELPPKPKPPYWWGFQTRPLRSASQCVPEHRISCCMCFRAFGAYKPRTLS